jgi:hypothetical protein
MSRFDSTHPPAEQLLRFGDGELSARESEQVRLHLDACGQCRAEHEEIRRTLAECAAFRQASGQLAPAPPRPWFDIRSAMADIDSAQLAGSGVFETALDSIRAFFSSPLRLAPVAMALAATGWVGYTLRFAPSVKAAELLHRASAVETAVETKAPKARSIRVRSGKRELTRLVAPKAVPAAALQDDGGLSELFRNASYNWDDPLSARSFSAWRDGLASKSDAVESVGAGQRITTTTDASDLSSASLTLAADLHASAGTFQFSSRERVEITEIPDLPTASAAISQPVAPATPGAPIEIPVSPSPVTAAPATAGDLLQVVSRLRQIGADLGEPIEVSRSGASVLVRGIGLDAGRQQQVRASLDGLANVAFDFSETGVLGWNPESTRTVAASGAAPPIRAKLEQNMGGHAAFEAFSSRVLDSTDQLMARLHALRRLAAHFPPPVEAELTSQDRQQLAQIRADHAAALARLASQVHRSVQPELTALGGLQGSTTGTVTPAPSWQSGADQLFELARSAERMLGSVLGGAAPPVPADEIANRLLTDLATLRALAEAYH